MKFSVAIALLLPALASAFAPAQQATRATSSLSAGAAKTFEDDLEKTRAVIATFFDRSDGSEPAEVEGSTTETETEEE